MKRIFMIIAVAMMTAVNVWGETQQWTSGNTVCTLTDDGTFTVSAIPGTNGEIADYDQPADRPWKNIQVEKLVVESGVTVLGKYVFHNFGHTDVSLPDGLKSIRSYAFRYCNKMTSISIPWTVTSVSAGAFDNCNSLLNIWCFPYAENLTWGRSSNDFIQDSEGNWPRITRMHVAPDQLEAYQAKFSGLNVTIKGDNIVTPTGYWTDEGNYSTSFREDGRTIYIDSEADLARMAYNINKGVTEYIGYTFVLTRDLYMNAHLWIPVGTLNHCFQTNIDGNGHAIFGLQVNRPNDEYVGFIGFGKNITIKNLSIMHSSITGRSSVGGVAGYILQGNEFFENVVCDATVAGEEYVGGIIGYFQTTSGRMATIRNTLFMGKSVTGSSKVGAFIGYVREDQKKYAELSNNYYTEELPVGSLNSLDERAYAVKTGKTPEGVTFDVYGNRGVSYKNIFYAPDGTTVRINPKHHFGVGKVVDVFVNGTQLVVGTDRIYSYTIHADGSATEYVVTATLAESGIRGDGTEDSPYVIACSNDWDIIASSIANGEPIHDKFFRLDSDITVTTRMGTEAHPFCGTFDGNGHRLTVDYTADSRFYAPFSYVNGATIKHLLLDGIIRNTMYSASSCYSYNASIIGQSNGNVCIYDCRSSVSLYGSDVGGLVGEVNSGSLEIAGCVFDGKMLSVTDTRDFCGGFVSDSYDGVSITIRDCFFAPTEIAVDGEYTFAQTVASLNIENSYFTYMLGIEQGLLGFKYTQPIADFGAKRTTYEASGITAYDNGLGFSGDYYNNTMLLSDLADNSELLTLAAGKKVSVSYDRTLRATSNADGTWSSRAYTVCLPFNFFLSKIQGNAIVRAYRLMYVKDSEFVFTNEFGYLSAGAPYLIVISEGELKFDASNVVVHCNPSDGYPVFEWSDDPAVSGKEVGLWCGTFDNISNDAAAELMAHTMSNDGKFRRISNAPGYQDAYIGTFRAFFTPYESDGYYDFTPKFVYENNGEKESDIEEFPSDSFEGDNDYSDQATGIGTIHTIDRDGTHRYYDMQGRQLRQRPAKGLYIENGKIQFNK